MSIEITLENWKEHKASEANHLFSVDDIVMYDHGFTRFTEKLGQVTKISPSGIVYAVKVELEYVKRNKLKHPSDCQMEGWYDYNPEKIVSKENEELKFLPKLEIGYQNYIDFNPEHPIKWNGPNGSGRYNLRPIKIRENGLVRTCHDSCL